MLEHFLHNGRKSNYFSTLMNHQHHLCKYDYFPVLFRQSSLFFFSRPATFYAIIHSKRINLCSFEIDYIWAHASHEKKEVYTKELKKLEDAYRVDFQNFAIVNR